MAAQADKGFTRGSIIAATDLIFLGLASRAKFNLKGIGTQTGVQALGGGTGEFLAQVASGDEISPGDILIESLAEGVSAPVDVAAFGLKKASETLKLVKVLKTLKLDYHQTRLSCFQLKI